MIARILPLALSLTACASAPAAVPEGPARLGQAVRIGGPIVRPLSVIEDSRCPANARCIWAGRVVVRAEVRGGDWRRTVDLTLGDAGVTVADGRLRLVSVTPERLGKPIPRTAYHFTFEFQGGL